MDQFNFVIFTQDASGTLPRSLDEVSTGLLYFGHVTATTVVDPSHVQLTGPESLTKAVASIFRSDGGMGGNGCPIVSICCQNILNRVLRLTSMRYKNDNEIVQGINMACFNGVLDLLEEVNKPAFLTANERYNFKAEPYLKALGQPPTSSWLTNLVELAKVVF